MKFLSVLFLLSAALTPLHAEEGMPMARAFAASATDTEISPPFQMKAGESTLNSSVTVNFELLPASQSGTP